MDQFNNLRETILVVEDAEPIRRLVMAMLSQSGYRCLEAPDGTEALSLLETGEGPVHLVLTDLLMPGMGGTNWRGTSRGCVPICRSCLCLAIPTTLW